MRKRIVVGVLVGMVLSGACGPPGGTPTKVPLYVEEYSCRDLGGAVALIPVTDGGTTEAGAVRRMAFGAYAGDASDPIVSNKEVRTRAALVCACGARRQRRASRTAGTESDVLLVGGALGTIGGGAINGLAATGVDDATRKSLLAAGLISMGVGALAIGLPSALNLNQRAADEAAAASDQEMAAAVLLNDTAGSAAWTRAWSACVTAEDAQVQARLNEPGASAFVGVDGGAATPEGAAPDAPH